MGLAMMTGSAGYAWAQAEEERNDPPEILTSELALRTLLESKRLEATFVIVDTDTITEVTIDGEPQEFEPGDTVVISKAFVFTEPETLVRVSATDETGQTRTVIYTVYLPGVDPQEVARKRREQLRTFVNYDVRFELDDNPSNDLSSPIEIEGIDLQGVVPDDEQDDTRINLNVNGGILVGPWNAFIGYASIDYSDAANEIFNVDAIYLGGGARIEMGEGTALELGYVFTDIDLGENDYAQTHTLSPGYRTSAPDEEGTERDLYGLDVIVKDFASARQEDDTVFTLKWDHNTLDSARQDSYRRLLVAGTASEGFVDTEFNFVGADFDWKNRWDSGVLFDIGFGVQYRDFPDDVPASPDTILGGTRVDIPLRFSTGLGYQFMPELRAMLNYSYVFDLSNKSPYVRQIFGISVNGAF